MKEKIVQFEEILTEQIYEYFYKDFIKIWFIMRGKSHKTDNPKQTFSVFHNLKSTAKIIRFSILTRSGTQLGVREVVV